MEEEVMVMECNERKVGDKGRRDKVRNKRWSRERRWGRRGSQRGGGRRETEEKRSGRKDTEDNQPRLNMQIRHLPMTRY